MTVKNKGVVIKAGKVTDLAYCKTPKYKTKLLYNDGEFLPIIHIEAEI